MTKSPIPPEISKGQHDNTKTSPKKFDYTAIADWLRTVRCSNYSYQTGGVYRFHRAHVPTHSNSCVMVGKNMQILLYSDIKVVNI